MFRVRVAISGTSGAPYVATHYFIETGGSAQEAADAAHSFWTDVAPHTSDNLLYLVEPIVVIVDSTTGLPTGAVAVSTTPISGGDANTELPRASQALIRWVTGIYVNGRQVRGRTFVPGLTENQLLAGGQLNPAAQAALNAAAADFVADANSILCVYSPTNALAIATTGGSSWGEFAVLRSRRD